jgi:hypothetical protein
MPVFYKEQLIDAQSSDMIHETTQKKKFFYNILNNILWQQHVGQA